MKEERKKEGCGFPSVYDLIFHLLIFRGCLYSKKNYWNFYIYTLRIWGWVKKLMKRYKRKEPWRGGRCWGSLQLFWDIRKVLKFNIYRLFFFNFSNALSHSSYLYTCREGNRCAVKRANYDLSDNILLTGFNSTFFI